MRLLVLAVISAVFAVTVVEPAAHARSREQAASNPRPRTYVVKKGEPLYLVAEKFGCSITELREVNKIGKSGVKAGTELNIPGCGYRISKGTSEKTEQQVGKKTTSKKPATKRKIRRIDEVDKSRRYPQSVGLPWRGRLISAEKLRPGSGYVIRRDNRSFGTHNTVRFVRAALADFHDAFPSAHVVAVGDISVKNGRRISQHASHQSGRDVDIGLLYNRLPDNYPAEFVEANASNLDLASTWGLVKLFASTAEKDGGAQTIFLDFDVQELLYNFALENGEDKDQLEKWFQFAHGRDSNQGIIRHIPNHADHLHIRFACSKSDKFCR